MEAIKSILSTIDDIQPAQHGEMTLYSPSRNLRVMITSAARVTEKMKDDFEAKACELKPEIALFVSAVADIDFDIANETSDGEHILCIYATREDLTPRFVRMLENMEPVPINETKEPKETSEPKEPKEPKSEKKVTPSKVAKTSAIDEYDDTPEGFDKYCHEIPKSKVEFKKAQLKWPKEMTPYKTASSFTDYVISTKTSKPSKTADNSATSTIEDFEKYITTTAASKITKTAIRSMFAHLPEAQKLIDSKNFREDVRDLKKSLASE